MNARQNRAGNGAYNVGFDPDIYASIDEMGSRPNVGNRRDEYSASDLYALSKNRVICCCFHIKACASVIITFSALAFLLKYAVLSDDPEIAATLQLLTYSHYYDNPDMVIAIVQGISLACFTVAVSIDSRFLVLPFLLYQTAITIAQGAIMAIYIFLAATGDLQNFLRPAEGFIRGSLKNALPDTTERILSSGDVVIGFVVVVLIAPYLLLNSYICSVTEQLFKYLRLKSVYRRLPA